MYAVCMARMVGGRNALRVSVEGLRNIDIFKT
jgi:hypothetical protein